MSYQLCPKCNGEKQVPHTSLSNGYSRCQICEGTGLISELTGLPARSKYPRSVTYKIEGNLDPQTLIMPKILDKDDPRNNNRPL